MPAQASIIHFQTTSTFQALLPHLVFYYEEIIFDNFRRGLKEIMKLGNLTLRSDDLGCVQLL